MKMRTGVVTVSGAVIGDSDGVRPRQLASLHLGVSTLLFDVYGARYSTGPTSLSPLGVDYDLGHAIAHRLGSDGIALRYRCSGSYRCTTSNFASCSGSDRQLTATTVRSNRRQRRRGEQRCASKDFHPVSRVTLPRHAGELRREIARTPQPAAYHDHQNGDSEEFQCSRARARGRPRHWRRRRATAAGKPAYQRRFASRRIADRDARATSRRW